MSTQPEPDGASDPNGRLAELTTLRIASIPHAKALAARILESAARLAEFDELGNVGRHPVIAGVRVPNVRVALLHLPNEVRFRVQKLCPGVTNLFMCDQLHASCRRIRNLPELAVLLASALHSPRSVHRIDGPVQPPRDEVDI